MARGPEMGLRWFSLKPRGNPQDRSVHRHVVLVAGKARTFRVVHEQRLVTEHGAPDDVVANTEIVVDGSQSLP